MKTLNERLAEAFTLAEWDDPNADFTASAMGLLCEAIIRLPPNGGNSRSRSLKPAATCERKSRVVSNGSRRTHLSSM